MRRQSVTVSKSTRDLYQVTGTAEYLTTFAYNSPGGPVPGKYYWLAQVKNESLGYVVTSFRVSLHQAGQPTKTKVCDFYWIEAGISYPFGCEISAEDLEYQPKGEAEARSGSETTWTWSVSEIKGLKIEL